MPGTRITRGNRTGSILIVLGLVGVLSFLPSPVAAATVSVDCAADPTALQPAIDAAEPGDIVNVTGTCFGNFTIDKDLTLQGTGTLDGNHQGPVLRIAGSRVTVADLTITNGTPASTFCRFTEGGGGIYNSGTLTLNSATVTDNAGGGIYNDCIFSNLILNGSTTVSGNSGFGIAIDLFSGATLNDAASVSNNTNGGIDIAHDGSVVMNDSSSVTRNGGRGIYDNGGVIMNGFSSVSGNVATFAGGGIFVALHQSLVMNDSASVSGNVAIEGGGISADWAAVTLNDSASVWGNSATRGGGISSFSIPELCSYVILNDSASVHDNTATGSGGGIATDSCNVTLNNSASVTGNVAGTNSVTGRGGGIWDSGVVITLNAASRIQGNKARGPGGDGGGIYLCPGVFGDGVLIQNGGVVKNNKPNDIKFNSTCSF